MVPSFVVGDPSVVAESVKNGIEEAGGSVTVYHAAAAACTQRIGITIAAPCCAYERGYGYLVNLWALVPDIPNVVLSTARAPPPPTFLFDFLESPRVCVLAVRHQGNLAKKLLTSLPAVSRRQGGILPPERRSVVDKANISQINSGGHTTDGRYDSLMLASTFRGGVATLKTSMRCNSLVMIRWMCGRAKLCGTSLLGRRRVISGEHSDAGGRSRTAGLAAGDAPHFQQDCAMADAVENELE
ncbi:hypothetical protein C8R44DRAFT_751136 [Mycena epipterygia]|nr:hypothetical protein C8R44DRAFT_751136 [Mycena epipterygia]